ncbi:MAG: hypothetical protein RLZZ200_174 [Pseudomonadota bacterium]|jgi:hypothetical protein
MLLTVQNLTTHETEFLDPSGNSTFKLKVAASSTESDVEITDAEFTAIEPLLIAEKTAGHIAWSVKRSTATAADSVPYNIKTVTTSPYNAVADEDLVYTNLVATAGCSVVLPTTAALGHEVLVLDGKGDAASNNVTVTVASGGTINGGASYVISTNKGGARLVKVAATEWRAFPLVGATGAPSGAAGGALGGSYPNPVLASPGLIFGTPTLTVSAEGDGAANAIDVTIQLKDYAGANLAAKAMVTVWVSDTAGGAPSAVAPTGGTSAVTGVFLKEYTTDVLLDAVSDASGVVKVRLTDVGTPTFYVNVATGAIVTSSAACTFA